VILKRILITPEFRHVENCSVSKDQSDYSFLTTRQPSRAAIVVTQSESLEIQTETKTSEGKAILNFGTWLRRMKTGNISLRFGDSFMYITVQ